MIALVFEDRCSGCGDCVRVCPMDVFDLARSETATPRPVIARQQDCQTCFLCELYCPTDALFVDPDCEAPALLDAGAVERSGLLGRYRRDSGWGEWAVGGRFPNEHWRMEQMFAIARALPPEPADS